MPNEQSLELGMLEGSLLTERRRKKKKRTYRGRCEREGGCAARHKRKTRKLTGRGEGEKKRREKGNPGSIVARASCFKHTREQKERGSRRTRNRFSIGLNAA